MFIRRVVAAMTMVVCPLSLLAQDAARKFEVVSVRSAPGHENEPMLPMGGPGTPDSEHVRYKNVALMLIVANAYGLDRDRISGPGWLNSARYDIMATVAPGTTVAEFKEMWVNLLAERFHMRVRREARDSSVYRLTRTTPRDNLKEAPPRSGTNPLGPSLFAAVQRLGLKLDKGRGPVEFLVIEAIDKEPDEN